MRLTLQRIFRICVALDLSPEELLSLNDNMLNNIQEKNYTDYEESGLFNELLIRRILRFVKRI